MGRYARNDMYVVFLESGHDVCAREVYVMLCGEARTEKYDL